jgi:hypothetical protein
MIGAAGLRLARVAAEAITAAAPGRNEDGPVVADGPVFSSDLAPHASGSR